MGIDLTNILADASFIGIDMQRGTDFRLTCVEGSRVPVVVQIAESTC